MKKILIVSLMSLFLSGAANAGSFGVGVSGSLAGVSASGKEADKAGTADTSMRTATAGSNVVIPSVFAEYSFDNGFTLGYDYTIGSADVNSSRLTRTDDSAEANQDGDRSAQATIENVMSVYAEVPLHAGLYVKGGIVQMDVNSEEKFSGTAAGAGTYGNEKVDGMIYGFGYKNSFGTNGYYKVEGSVTEMDGMTFKSSTTDKGNQITADLDVVKATFAVGYAF